MAVSSLLQALGESPSTDITTIAPLPPSDFVPVAREAHVTVWERTVFEQTPDGLQVPRIVRVTELATGLNYKDSSGQWVPSSTQIEPAEGGAVARQGQTKVWWANNLADQWPIQIESPTGKPIKARVLGIVLSDHTGKSVWIAHVKESQGYITDDSAVIYPDCMEGVKASLRIRYMQAGIEQDLLIEESLEGLGAAQLGLDPQTASIALVTEFESAQKPRVMLVDDPSARKNSLTDSLIDFDDLKMRHGKAWLTSALEEEKPVKVYKQWLEDTGRQFLFEQIPIASIADDLNTLPRQEASVLSDRQNLRYAVTDRPTFPRPQFTARQDKSLMRLASQEKNPTTLAALQPRPAFLLDYQLMASSGTNFQFLSDMTYHVSGQVNLAGTTRLQGGTVIKIGSSSTAGISTTNLLCETAPYRPAVITSVNDNTCGETLNGSTGDPTGKYYGGTALNLLGAPAGSIVSGVFFSHLSNALSGAQILLRDSQVIRCRNAFVSGSSDPTLENVLLYRLFRFMQNEEPTTVTALNVTAHLVTNFLYNVSGTVNLTNCLLSRVNGWEATTTRTNATIYLSTDTGVFQTVGGGQHYLSAQSPYRGVGATNLPPSLLSRLRNKTSYPPTVYTSTTFTNDVVFGPTAPRNTNSVDIGYLYDPLDYAFGGSHALCNVTFSPGTAVGWFRTTSGTYRAGQGIHLGDQKTLKFDGLPEAPCYWVRTPNVQERLNGTWLWGPGQGGITGWASSTNLSPQVLLNFTVCASLAGEGNHFRDDSGWLTVRANHSILWNGGYMGYCNNGFFTNCLFSGHAIGNIEGTLGNETAFQNCTMRGGQVRFAPDYWTTVLTVFDTAFDNTQITVSGPVSLNADYNAYKTGGTRLTRNGTHDKIVTSFDWEIGPSGSCYLPTNSVLIDAGSRTADQAGLFHFTSVTSGQIEAASTVDIGYHYLPLAANGLPIDSDADGTPDYLDQDSDGDGLPDSWELQYFGNLLQTQTADSDADGLSNLAEFEHGTNPTNIDTDGDGLTDSEELQIPIDVNNPALGYLDPLSSDTANVGTPDGQKDADRDGLANLAELRRYKSSPSTNHTFNPLKDDGEYLFTAEGGLPDGVCNTKARLDIFPPLLPGDPFGFIISQADPRATFDLFFVPNLVCERWQWRRVLSGINCNTAGEAQFELEGPDPFQGYFTILDAADDDGDGLSNGYECWFTYGGQRTSPNDSDSDKDGMRDSWEIQFGLNPTIDLGKDGKDADPDDDDLTNLTEHNGYYSAGPLAWNANYDPLMAYSAGACVNCRGVVTISDSPLNVSRDIASFTLTRSRGTGASQGQDLKVYYSVGGTLRYGTDYTLDPVPETDPNDPDPDGPPRVFLATIPAGSDSKTVLIRLLPSAPAGTVVIAVTPYSVSPRFQVPVEDADLWKYVVDWEHNRAMFTFAANNPLELPEVGATYMKVISPSVLELVRITASTDSTTWNFVQNGIPNPNRFQVLVDGATQTVEQVGFKQRPRYTSFQGSDIRLEKSLYLKLLNPFSGGDNTVVEVKNPQADLWSPSLQFIAPNAPLRYSPAIHVNQDGYLGSQSKKAKVGYYLGTNPGNGWNSELELSLLNFYLVDSTGADVHQGTLTARPDTGWNSGQAQYQNVLEADFTSFNTPGTYRLRVPGVGASFPFMISDSAALKWARAYALGLYHQRCGNGVNGAVNDMPFTRFTHGNCHFLPAYIPNMNMSPQWPDNTSVNFHNSVLNEVSNADDRYAGQTAQRLYNFNQSLYPFSNIASDPNSTITKDVSGGHHDAGDYSKYVSNSGFLIHMLVFAADNFPGAGDLNNLGIPESGNVENGAPVSDLLDEAKWEADFLLKMQDRGLITVGGQQVPDGGFYFLVYPQSSRYESTTPDRGPRQLLYPKTTCVTASSVAALAEIGSSPAFIARFPNKAADYRAAALDGWNFLLRAINSSSGYPYADKYQRITHYGDVYLHQDELVWAAAAIFSAFAADPATQTIAADAHQRFIAWLPNVLALPKDYGPLFGGIGCAVRNYAFAERSGRPLGGFSLDSPTLTRCENTILNDAALWRDWSLINSYGVSLSDVLKRTYTPRWFFPTCDAAFDIAVGDRLLVLLGGSNPSDPRYPDHLNNLQSLFENFNFQHGCNPLNLSFVTGSGSKWQREIVQQYSHYPNYDTRLLPPTGVPYGAISFRTEPSGIDINGTSGCYVDGFFYPPSGDCIGGQHACDANSSACSGTSSFGLYDRWGDHHNVNREFVAFQTARALGAAVYLHSFSGSQYQPWTPVPGKIVFPNGTPALNSSTVVRLDLEDNGPTIDLDTASVVWDVEGESQPAFGRTFTIKPRTMVGDTLVEAEAVLPDGRRVFGRSYLRFNASVNGGTEYVLPNANTVALYHFNDPEQAFSDSTQSGYHLASSGFVDNFTNNSWMQTSVTTGRAARFGGIGDRLQSSVTIPDSVLRPGGSGAFTVEFRMYPKRLPNSGSALYLFRFAQGQPGNNGSEWSLYYRTDLGVFPQLFGPNGQLVLNSETWAERMTPNTWHLVKLTVATSGFTSVYVDDMSSPAATSPISPSFSGVNWMLSFGDFVGCIDEVRISKGVQ